MGGKISAVNPGKSLLTFRHGVNMSIISEPKIKHILWNHLENSGYEVSGEVTVVSGRQWERRRLYPIMRRDGTIIALQDGDRRTIIEGKEIVNHFLENNDFRLASDNNGELVLIEKGRAQRIDLVATKDERFIGYEAKKSFGAVSVSISVGQLKTYKNSRLLDYLYIIIPIDEYEHVNTSYGHVFDREGIGIVGISERGIISELKDAKKLSREGTPIIRKNEAWLTQKLRNYFESEGFDVEGEGRLPISDEEWFKVTYGGSWNPASKLLLPIDLCLLARGKDPTFVLNNQSRFDHIGVEVKYNLRGVNKKKLEEQMRRYAKSKAITKLFLAVPYTDMHTAEQLDGVGEKFGIFGYKVNEKRMEVIDAPKLPMEFDGFGYWSKEGLRIWRVGSSTFVSPPRGKESVKERFSKVVVYDSSKRKSHIERGITFRIFKSGKYIVEKQTD